MRKIAEAGNLILYETAKGRGFVENTDTKVKTPEKEIISLISMSDEWVATDGVAKEDEPVRRYRDELADLEEEVGFRLLGKRPIQKKDEPVGIPDGETYNVDEAGPKTA